MEIAFVGEKYKFIEIYLNDMIVFSKTNDEHLSHLTQTFNKCSKYELIESQKVTLCSARRKVVRAYCFQIWS